MTIKIHQKLLWLIFAIYLVIVIKLTMFKGVIGTIEYDPVPQVPIKERLEMAQFVPFHTIKEYLLRDEQFEYKLRRLSPSQEIEYTIQNLVGNIILFMPIGFLIPAVYPPTRSTIKIVIISFFASLTIEIIQFITSRGIFDVDDLILNTIGGLLGYVCMKYFKIRVVLNR
jgi:glycopeptide antibiotics resistance protein